MATATTPPGSLRELHVSRPARDRYRFDDSLFSLRGTVIFANFHAARLFAQRLNDNRDLARYPEKAVSAGEINALGLIDEILHLLIAWYRREQRPGVLGEALEYLEEHCGEEAVEEALTTFVDEFPPLSVYRRQQTPEQYYRGASDGESHREVALEELLLLWLTNQNPAAAPYRELFDDDRLQRRTAYPQVMKHLQTFFATLPPPGHGFSSLIDLLRAPALASPHSLEGQLELLRTRFATLLGPLLYRLLSSLDLLAEEHKAWAFDAGPGPALPPDLTTLDQEVEAYSTDLEWMPRLVLLAKNVYVWLHQLSRSYDRPIDRLDQVPDEELDTLASWGITGLWLIGLWQRSRASQRIKVQMGNPEAVASAYSLDQYRVADELGGEAAFDNLRDRAWQRGIRMASDMVPNHVGIDSRWVIEHPDWFIGLDYSPFPAYSFNGPDLCDDERVGIYLEDHYWDRSDAAVVFKRVDHHTGSCRYLYHGNDGTSMPWNDTAQLDYRKPEVREAVMQSILAVARRSPIIRFDAAMTLTKLHYQRLWFPQPGGGGDIPSRADFAMTREEFDAAVPQELWREVVDRVAAEAPDTLLLAEAFWLLEGYFVRTLGMHRVYNSAFMNMLRDERNADYQKLLRDTLEYDPQILKRYVNFMSNPDERTAIDQFGKDDKYFGVCTLMATLPGLPMLGHGQVEGYGEKYGMEYRRAYQDERPDQWLLDRHRRQIFPLLRRRYLFADVQHFQLYDLVHQDGSTCPDVFAYSNRAGDERALVIYHNRYADTAGWLRSSVAVAVRGEDGERSLRRSDLGDELALDNQPDAFVILHDQATGLQYLRSCSEVHHSGLYVELHAYQLHVLLDPRQVVDDPSQRYRRLCHRLAGRGVPSIEEALTEMVMEPVLRPFRQLVAAPTIRRLMQLHRAPAEPNTRVDREASGERPPDDRAVLPEEIAQTAAELEAAILRTTGGSGEPARLARRLGDRLEALLDLPSALGRLAEEADTDTRASLQSIAKQLHDDPATCATLLAWAVTVDLGALVSGSKEEIRGAELSRSWLDEWLLGSVIRSELQALGLSDGSSRRAVATVKLLLAAHLWPLRFCAPGGGKRLLSHLLAQPEARALLGVNRYHGTLWFNQQCFEELLLWLLSTALLEIAIEPDEEQAARFAEVSRLLAVLRRAEEASGYRVDHLLSAAGEAAEQDEQA